MFIIPLLKTFKKLNERERPNMNTFIFSTECERINFLVNVPNTSIKYINVVYTI